MEWGLRDYGSETVRIWGGLPKCEHEWGNDIIKKQTTPTAFAGRFGEGYNRIEKPSEDITVNVKTSFCVKCGAWRGSLGLEPHPQLFIDHLVEICREIKRVLKPSGTFWMNLGDTYYGSGGKGGQYEKFMPNKGQPTHYRQSSKTRSKWLQPKQLLMIPARVAIALQHDGWILRNDIIWHKPNHMPSSAKDRLTNAYEHVFLFAKQGRYYFDLDAIRKPHKESTLQREQYGHKISKFMGGQNRHKELLEKGFIKLEMNPRGKNPGDLWEIEEEKLTKHDIAVGRIGNFSYTDPLHTKEYHPKGKNPGDLWRIPTAPFHGAHFAVFPSALIKPIVKAGCPRWICSRCGKPRERILEKSGRVRQHWAPGTDVKTEAAKGPHGKTSTLVTGYKFNYETVGWSECGCGEKWVGGVVLDPFGGSGTVGKVARKLGRRFILIEIIPEYCKMAEQRVRGKYKPVPEGATPFTQDIDP